MGLSDFSNRPILLVGMTGSEPATPDPGLKDSTARSVLLRISASSCPTSPPFVPVDRRLSGKPCQVVPSGAWRGPDHFSFLSTARPNRASGCALLSAGGLSAAAARLRGVRLLRRMCTDAQ